ncbi:MAG: hypothetical protein LBS34_00660 [Rickettsiales bacterium]|nr:hypothetical protein [Rickettsiales bacterium]
MSYPKIDEDMKQIVLDIFKISNFTIDIMETDG